MAPETRNPRMAGSGHNNRLGGRIDYAALTGRSQAGRIDVQSDPVSLLLSRLQNSRRYGEGCRADCPLGHSSRGTLSVTTGHDGRALVHCFVGCSPGDIAAAAGLRLADLFVQPVTCATPEERRAARLRAREANWSAALGVAAAESTHVVVAAVMLARGQPLMAEDIERLQTASNRLHAAREVLR